MTGTARSEQTSQAGDEDEMDQKDDQIAHHRIVAGQKIPTNYGRNNNSPGTGSPAPLQRETNLNFKRESIVNISAPFSRAFLVGCAPPKFTRVYGADIVMESIYSSTSPEGF
jgi:hypothetical protein